MSFGVSDARTGLEFRASNLNSLFAQRRNLVNPSFLRLLTEIVRFNRAARRLVDDEPRWAGRRSTRRRPRRAHATTKSRSPSSCAAAGTPTRSSATSSSRSAPSIWSADPETFTQFPVRAYARFMHNHGLLELKGRPQWRTITGGSRTLPRRADRAVRRPDPALGAGAEDRRRVDDGAGEPQVELLTERGPESFDRVVIAAHSDQALRLLGDATPAERSILGAIGYQRNVATLHTDARMLPDEPTGARELELRGRCRRPPGDGDLLDEPAAVDREPSPAAPHAQPPRRDRRPAACWPSSSTTIRCSTPPRSRRSAGGTRSRVGAGSTSPARTGATASTKTACRARARSSRRSAARAMTATAPALTPVRPSTVAEHDGCRRSTTARSATDGSARCRATFTPKLFLAYLDVDALPGSLDALPLWSARRAAPVRFRRRRLLRRRDRDRSATQCAISSRNGSAGDRRDRSTSSRTSAPSDGSSTRSPSTTAGRPTVDGLDAVVLEVTNTPWGERHWYVFDARDGRDEREHRRRRCTSRRSCRWTSTTGSRGPCPAPTRGCASRPSAPGVTVFEADLALRRDAARPAPRASRVLARYR